MIKIKFIKNYKDLIEKDAIVKIEDKPGQIYIDNGYAVLVEDVKDLLVNERITQSKDLVKDDKEKINVELKIKLLEAQKMKDYALVDEIIEQIVNEVKSRRYIKTWKDDVVTECWIYSNGKYLPNGESCIREEIREMLGSSYSTYIFNKIMERIKVDTYIDPEEFVKRSLDHPYEINALNGIIKIDKSNYNITLVEHDPEKIFINQLPINYNPDATCPANDKFLSEALSSPEDKHTVYEAIGVSLDLTVIPKKAFIASGPKDSGKTTWLHSLQSFFGEVNCSNLNIQQMTQSAFLKSKLLGKYVNIASEISSEEVKGMEEFKALTGGDYIEGDRKFKNAISFRNLAKLFFGTNTPPKIYNADDAFWGRLVLLPFNRVALPLDKYNQLKDELKSKYVIMDEKLRDKLTTPEELAGLLNKALEGLIRYYKTANFSYSKSLEEVKMAWIKDSDSFAAFCMEFIQQGDFNEDYIFKKDLLNKYTQYCIKHKIKSCSDKAIKATLNSRYGVSSDHDEKKYTGIKDEQGNYITDRYWSGIKWKGVF